MTSLQTFAFILALGAIAGVALGGDFRLSLGLWLSLVAAFAFGLSVGKEERDAD